jgi:hypothetical protein
VDCGEGWEAAEATIKLGGWSRERRVVVVREAPSIGPAGEQKLSPCRIMANLIALFYNWWNLYVRFYDDEHHREAITSRPAFMQGVARQVHSAG